MAARVTGHPDKSGVYAMPIPSDAFAARAILASTADKSLDIQYYVWHGDQTGYLLFEAIWRAADRGVRVRILLDDANTGGLDETIATLDAHPNIEVRLYNPLMQRGARAARADAAELVQRDCRRPRRRGDRGRRTRRAGRGRREMNRQEPRTAHASVADAAVTLTR